MKLFFKFLFLFAASITTVFAQEPPLPTDGTSLFSGSGNCNACHTPGPGHVLTDSLGNDLSPVKDWRSTMMANAARDPYWLAKVETEVKENPHLQIAIEDKCSTCHMPMGRTQAIADEADSYSIAEGLENPLAMDGVSCTVCHQIQPTNLGQQSSFSGGYIIDSSRVIYGPYENVNASLMESGLLYQAVHGPHMLSSQLCATCHTLYTNFVDNNGKVAGSFPEQMPYFEWLASIYPSNGVQCQNCHIKRVDEDIVISWLPAGLDPQNPLFKHQFVGGNTFMLTMFRENGEQIGTTATEAHFDSTIAHTRNQLQNKTVNLTTLISQEKNVLNVKVKIENLAGHKFPTAYPGRRAWLHVTVVNSVSDTIFESGAYDDKGIINSRAEDYSPHFDSINNENDVQIYEAVMGDIDGKVTQVLLRAANYLKDNRIPPVGFSSSAERYDDIAIRGLAESDQNFNAAANGSDEITYLVDISGESSGAFTVNVELLYQSVNPVDIEYFRSFETGKVNTFLEYYDKANKQPELIKSSITEIPVVVNVSEVSKTQPGKFALLQNYPNPFNPSTTIDYKLSEPGKVVLKIFDITGREIKTLINREETAGDHSIKIDADNLPSGIYIYQLQSGKYSEQKKMLLLR